MLNERVGNNIRVHRTEAGLTQEELAYRAKMNAPILARWSVAVVIRSSLPYAALPAPWA